MNNSLCLRTLYAVSIYMRHDIMTDDLLPLLCHLIVDIILMCLQLCDLFIRDVQPELLLCLRQCDPKLSPCPELHIRRKNILHFLTCIPL